MTPRLSDAEYAGRFAQVELPATADGIVSVRDRASSLTIQFALATARPGVGRIAGGIAVYEGVFGPGTRLFHRPSADGTEDSIELEAPLAAPFIDYLVDVSSAAGLRLVDGTLELLDASGAPRLRAKRPYVIDHKGLVVLAHPTLLGCQADTSAVPPWGRPVTAPGKAHCTLRVAWDDAALRYPILIDPSWTSGATALASRYEHAATRLGDGRVLVTGGAGSTAPAAEIYDPTSKTWGSTGAMVDGARSAHTASLISPTKVLIAGGDTPTPSTSEVFENGSFTASGSMSANYGSFTATVLSAGRVLAVGEGRTELYQNGTWTLKATPSYNVGYNHVAALLPNDRVLIAGGETGGGQPSLSAAIYASVAGSWANTGPMKYKRIWAQAVVLGNGKALVVGGDDWDLNTQTSAELFDDATGKFTLAGTMSQARAEFGLALLTKNGRVLAAGGWNDIDWLRTADLYDPSTNAWVPTKDMVAKRQQHTLTELTNGTALVVGGNTKPEIYTLDPAGAACASSSECETGHCVDGVCCDTACTGSCQACTQTKKGSGIDGVCAVVAAGTDPDDDCAAGTATGCGTTGVCTAAGTCQLYALGVQCQAPACAGTSLDTFECDGQGACKKTTVDCAPFACGAASCGAACQSSSDCAATAWCNSNICVPKSANAAACATGEACSSGNCVDGHCCSSVCPGQCEACDVSGAEGTCAPVSGAPHGSRPACPAGDVTAPCSTSQCDGNVRTSCQAFVGPSVVCQAAKCVNGVATQQGTCDGKSSCSSGASTNCEPFACGATGCKGTCATDADCAGSYHCSGGKCATAAICDGDHTVTDANGTPTDCSPYKCDPSGACRGSCASIADCTPGNVCSAAGTCTPTTSGKSSDSGDGGGCSTVPGGAGGSGSSGWLGLLSGLFFVARRRR